jgi:hypothetical protein
MRTLIFFIFSLTFSQNLRWAYYYNGPGNDWDYACSIVYGLDNNIYVAGRNYGGDSTGYDLIVVSLTNEGEERWVYCYDGPAHDIDRAWSIVYGLDNNIYVAGGSKRTRGEYDFDFIVISLTNEGEERWVYRRTGNIVYGWDEAYSIVYGLDNNIYVGGLLEDTAGPFFTVISLDTNGNERFLYKYEEQWGCCWSLAYDLGNNIYATGEDLLTISLTNEGEERWVYHYNPHGICAYSIVYGLDNNIYISGITSGNNFDIIAISLTNEGEERWVYQYNGPADSWDKVNCLKSIVYGLDNNIYIAGESQGIGTSLDFIVISLNRNGEERWVYRYNGPANYWDRAWSIVYGLDNNIYAAGESYDSFTHLDFIIVSLDTNGNERFLYRYDRVNGPDRALCMAYGSDNNIYVAGESYNPLTYFDLAVISLNSEVAVKEDSKIRLSISNNFNLSKEGRIYDITGKRINFKEKLKPGIYFFKKDKKNFLKVIIKPY